MEETIEYAALETLFLDSRNPRLGLPPQEQQLSQEEVYRLMCDWSLEELATSFLENGFWSHEPVICCEEALNGKVCLIVIEGNRRIATLQRLRRALRGSEASARWKKIIELKPPPDSLFEKIPFIRVSRREDVDAFLGYRHVTGIKQWPPTQKAKFIARLIDDRKLSYTEVMRKIGSKTAIVERNYISYCILRQMDETEGIDSSAIHERFSVLFLSLRSSTVQRFLGVDVKFNGDPSTVHPPIDSDHIQHLQKYALWLFGTQKTAPIVTDSREMDKFAQVLSSDDALQYLKTARIPSLERAFTIAGGDLEEVTDLVRTANIKLEEALSTIHFYKSDKNLRRLSSRLIDNARQIGTVFELELP